ncbi:MAG: hypothetical protein DBX91_14095 [Subdoligranulum variabile]|uniref:hypothetical protein n=1 Tax=Gemmiger formicilis TaxID=745368 RepID=UPI000D7B32AC|nr:MAG: hypothetical protein DBX91_14095 [Subdoligranulum variabile]
MAFTRKALAGLGLNEDAIEKVMALHGTSMADFIPKSELQDKITEAVEKAKKDAPPIDVTTTDAYKAIAEERDMLRALGGDEFASVKPKFREAVYKMLDRSEGAPSTADQLKTVQEKYEEYFNPAEPAEPAKTPQFGAGVQGSMPTGKTTPSFGDYWGFGKTKGE